VSHYFRAVAVDYDGTLAVEGPPRSETLAALDAVRESGRRLILVTGRILDELRAVYPAVDAHFDAVVAENGAVLSRPDARPESLAAPVPHELEQALAGASIATRAGEVLLEISGNDAAAALVVIGHLGLDCQILRNRGAAMILPLGVSKATGLRRALASFGLSPHNCVSAGDAENDHALLDACEIGVAAAGAIGALKAHADLVLGGDLGELLRRIADDDLAGVESRRWRLDLGWTEHGIPLTIPASRANLLITGAPGSGKSYLAGLIAEQLAELGYSTCVLDLEGDHEGLAERGGVVVVGGAGDLPPPERLPNLIRHRADSTLIVDLSNRPDDLRRGYSLAALESLQRLRDQCGMPQWVILEEAHLPLVGGGQTGIDFGHKGICMVSYRADEIAAGGECDGIIELGRQPATLRWRGGEPRAFMPATRDTPHVRHLHKYEQHPLPPHRRFYFRDSRGLTGRVAGSLLRFRDDLAASSVDVLRHHARGREMSRWIRDVILDVRFAVGVRDLEAEIDHAGSDREVLALRDRLVAAVDDHCGPAR
jgi:hypothetical protein